MLPTFKRPRGLVPGSVEWLREIEGPRLIHRLVREVHAGAEGEMTPTQARCAAMLLDRIAPSVSSVTHTIETSYSRMTEEQLKEELKKLLADEQTEEQTSVEDVAYIEHVKSEAHIERADGEACEACGEDQCICGLESREQRLASSGAEEQGADRGLSSGKG